uniref:Eukaryotic translation initiation factor 3 subunit I n=1 Tax=Meloidogyne floridensis TaxID=298350 RepID=A0A915P771_9BILA
MKPLSLKGHGRPITRVRINQEGDILFSSGKDKHICVWYTENGERIGTYEGHTGVVWDVDVSWDTKTLVSASGDQHMMVWDVETGAQLNDSEVGSVVRSIGLSYSGNLAVLATQKAISNRAGVFVQDLREFSKKFEPTLRIEIDQPSSTCLFSHLDDTIVLGTQNGQLHLYDLRQPNDAKDFSSPHNFPINELQKSVDETFLISSSKDKTAQLHDSRTLQQLKKYKSTRPVNSAAISPTRDHIILGGGEESVNVTMTSTSSGQFEAKLYHMIFEEEFARFKGHFGPINSITFDPTGDIVVSGGEDGYVRIQELDQSYKDFEFDIGVNA